jgi:hypothetical protein
MMRMRLLERSGVAVPERPMVFRDLSWLGLCDLLGICVYELSRKRWEMKGDHDGEKLYYHGF